LKGWPKEHAYGNASVADFQRYAERVSGKPLAALFGTWLFQPSKPAGSAAHAVSLAKAGTTVAQPKSWKKIEAAHGGHGN
ncbi:M1 family peptidase, partial [Streptomyces broussonetiae]